MPITIYGDGYITGLGNVSTSGNVTSNSVVVTNGVTFPDGTTQTALPIGYGQTWQNVLSSRAAGTTYTNSTGKPIMVSIWANVNASNTWYWTFSISGVTVSSGYGGGGASAYYLFPCALIVPPGATYVFTVVGAGGISGWAELR